MTPRDERERFGQRLSYGIGVGVAALALGILIILEGEWGAGLVWIGIGVAGLSWDLWRRHMSRRLSREWPAPTADRASYHRYVIVVSLAFLAAGTYLLILGINYVLKDSIGNAVFAIVGASCGLFLGLTGLLWVLVVRRRDAGRGGRFGRWWLGRIDSGWSRRGPEPPRAG
jgi:hypothetical protein